jgi:hypothetical protein
LTLDLLLTATKYSWSCSGVLIALAVALTISTYNELQDRVEAPLLRVTGYALTLSLTLSMSYLIVSLSRWLLG